MSPSIGVTFQSDYFSPVPGENEETNPGRYGKESALWLAEELRKISVSVEGVRAEDFGWIILVSHQHFLLWLGCGNVGGSTDEWHVYPVAESSLIQRVFQRLDTKTDTDTLWQHVRKLIPQIPAVKNIVWQ